MFSVKTTHQTYITMNVLEFHAAIDASLIQANFGVPRRSQWVGRQAASAQLQIAAKINGAAGTQLIVG